VPFLFDEDRSSAPRRRRVGRKTAEKSYEAERRKAEAQNKAESRKWKTEIISLFGFSLEGVVLELDFSGSFSVCQTSTGESGRIQIRGQTTLIGTDHKTTGQPGRGEGGRARSKEQGATFNRVRQGDDLRARLVGQ
jgi:hypothetical protein